MYLQSIVDNEFKVDPFTAVGPIPAWTRGRLRSWNPGMFSTMARWLPFGLLSRIQSRAPRTLGSHPEYYHSR